MKTKLLSRVVDKYCFMLQQFWISGFYWLIGFDFFFPFKKETTFYFGMVKFCWLDFIFLPHCCLCVML